MKRLIKTRINRIAEIIEEQENLPNEYFIGLKENECIFSDDINDLQNYDIQIKQINNRLNIEKDIDIKTLLLDLYNNREFLKQMLDNLNIEIIINTQPLDYKLDEIFINYNNIVNELSEEQTEQEDNLTNTEQTEQEDNFVLTNQSIIEEDIPVPDEDYLNITDDIMELGNNAVDEYVQNQTFSIPTEYNQKYEDTTAEEYVTLKQQSIPEDTNNIVQSNYWEMCEQEPPITEIMQYFANNTQNTELSGLISRTKEGDSYNRKVESEMNKWLQEKNENKNLSEEEILQQYDTISKAVEDGIRYTFVCDPNTLVETYFDVVNKLKNAGYEIDSITNTWLDPQYGMNVVKCYFLTSTNQKFEVWFHTPETKNTLDNYHKYYEVLRTTKDKNILMACDKILHNAYYSCRVPKNIKQIKNI